MKRFTGRSYELSLLNGLRDKRVASLVVIKGRRRIGKSRLIEQFGAGQTFYSFSGIPPSPKDPPNLQRNAFSKQLQKIFHTPVKSDDWFDLLWFLAEKTRKGKIVISLDEISWMGSQDPDFLGKLRTVWETEFKKNPELILVLCSSISSWLENNILSSTGFLGRISLTLTLSELSLQECDAFFGKNSHMISDFEKLTFLSVTGGIPKYLEELNPKLSAEENIKRMCFEPSGSLFNEFDQTFSDLFSSRSYIYKQIVRYLAEHRANRNEIAKALQMELGGVISDYLDDLSTAGFIARDFSWDLKAGKTSKLSTFRLSDNYSRFYLKYILPNRPKIEAHSFQTKPISTLPGWSSIMGLQFENLVLHNRQAIHEILKIHPEDIVSDGYYFQRKTAKKLGCQIDYLIQTKFNSLYVCEIKFSKNNIELDVIDEMKNKITALAIPKNFSVRPILIHANSLSGALSETDYFSNIIHFGELLRSEKS